MTMSSRAWISFQANEGHIAEKKNNSQQVNASFHRCYGLALYWLFVRQQKQRGSKEEKKTPKFCVCLFEQWVNLRKSGLCYHIELRWCAANSARHAPPLGYSTSLFVSKAEQNYIRSFQDICNNNSRDHETWKWLKITLIRFNYSLLTLIAFTWTNRNAPIYVYDINKP